MRLLILGLLLLCACDSPQCMANELRLCANQYGQYSCSGVSDTNGASVFSGPGGAVAEALGGLAAGIAQNIDGFSRAFEGMREASKELKERYAPPAYVHAPPTSEAEWQARREKVRREILEERDRHIESHRQEMEEREKEWYRAFREPLNAYKEYSDEYHQYIANIRLAMQEISNLQFLQESASDLGRQQMGSLLSEFIDGRGLVKKWSSELPQIQNLIFSTSLSNRHGNKVREAINRALMYRHLAHRNGSYDHDLFQTMLETAIQADRSFSHREKLGERYINRNVRMVNYATNDSAIQKYYLPKTIPSDIQTEFDLEGISPDTFIGHEIILTARVVAANDAALKDDVSRFVIGAFFHQAKSFALENRIKDALAMLDRVLAVVDFALGFVPVVGDFKDNCEAVTGRHMCMPDGNLLSQEERVFAAMGTVIGSGAMWKGGAKYFGEAWNRINLNLKP